MEPIDHILTTTRSVRRRLDLARAVDPEVIEQCLEIAIQAPSGSDRQGWEFVVLTEPEPKQAIAELYRRAFAAYIGAPPAPGTPVSAVRASATLLAEQFHLVPAMVLFCYAGRVERQSVAAQAALYGSILPAAWSFMLALRARGIGSAWTTLHLVYEREAAAALGIPHDWTQAALVPLAYFTGTGFKPARRAPAREKTSWNGWGQRRDPAGT